MGKGLDSQKNPPPTTTLKPTNKAAIKNISTTCDSLPPLLPLFDSMAVPLPLIHHSLSQQHHIF